MIDTTDVLVRLQQRYRERDFCLAVLELWAGVKKQGIESESVKSFGFDEKLLTRRERLTSIWDFLERSTGKRRAIFHNYVRLHDDTTVQLNPMLKAVYED
jgi:hypothetical protein